MYVCIFVYIYVIGLNCLCIGEVLTMIGIFDVYVWLCKGIAQTSCLCYKIYVWFGLLQFLSLNGYDDMRLYFNYIRLKILQL